MNNCFTYTYKKLIALGYTLPQQWEDYDYIRDTKLFIRDYKWFLENRKHIRYFESFCEYVDLAEKNDIIINDNGVGVAINKYKYMTIQDKDGKSCLCDITKDDKKLRIING